jgi:hypothetical protein
MNIHSDWLLRFVEELNRLFPLTRVELVSEERENYLFSTVAG